MKSSETKNQERGLRKLEIALAVVALSFYLICLVSATALADDAPSADISRLKPEATNAAYLNKVDNGPAGDGSLNSMIFDKTMSTEMTQKYNAFDRPYEAREIYRLNTPEDYAKYQKSNADLAEWTIKKLLQYHFETTLKNQVEQGAKRASEDPSNKDAQGAASAVVAVSSVQKALTNSTFNMGNDTKTRFKYDFPSGLMKVGMTGPIAEATMDYRMKAANPAVGAVSGPEKLSVGLNKKVQAIGVSSSVRYGYGMNNQTVNYNMNKSLVGPLSAQVDQFHNIRDTSRDETVYRINLGFNF